MAKYILPSNLLAGGDNPILHAQAGYCRPIKGLEDEEAICAYIPLLPKGASEEEKELAGYATAHELGHLEMGFEDPDRFFLQEFQADLWTLAKRRKVDKYFLQHLTQRFQQASESLGQDGALEVLEEAYSNVASRVPISVSLGKIKRVLKGEIS